ncbi:MAG: group II intron reverse transcriptase/maturase [Mediterranea sp.]|nr:group II intron reverse transcriptase/maturase [Mediterranea sp.]
MSPKSDSCPQKDRTASESYVGVRTCMGITENNLVEVRLPKEDLLERILSPSNLNMAYKRVKSNGGSGGVDKLGTEDLLPYLRIHKDALVSSLRKGRYRPNPVRRVEIPKPDGGVRKLGVPTVVDRMIQQSISQILMPIYEREFSDNSFGFRPNRGCHDALKRAQLHLNAGYTYCVDLDLEKFFDTVQHSKLIEILSRRIKDGRVISLIHKYLNAGVMVRQSYEATTEGVPQGGNLSPLLSNVMLNEMDKELERRGHKFVRYADDCMIFCKSKRGAERVKESMTKYIEEELHLRVNRKKTTVGYVRGMKYLGYSFYKSKGEWRLSVHPKSYSKMETRIRELTSRSSGKGYVRLKQELAWFIRGWVGYFHLADMQSRLQRTDEWLRRRIRMCIWKYWKKAKTKFANLQRCGLNKGKAWEYANTRLGYWRIAGSYILSTTITNERLLKAGYPSFLQYYGKLHRK